MNIKIDEAERCLRTVCEQLRKNWELRHLKNEDATLLTVSEDRKNALRQMEMCNKKSNRVEITVWIEFILLIIIVTYPISSGYINKWLASAAVVVSGTLLITGILWKKSLSNKIDKARVVACESGHILNEFNQAVEMLNLRSTLITEEAINERLVTLAYVVLDANERFHKCRIRPESSRYLVIRYGKRVETSEHEFYQVWNSATEKFGLVLNKADIFRQAQQELNRTGLT